MVKCLALNMHLLRTMLALISVTLRAATACAMTRLDAEKCSVNLNFLGDRKFRYPTSLTEAEPLCRKFHGGVNCYMRYSRCFTGFKGSLLKAVVRQMRGQVRDNCSPDMLKFMLQQAECLDNGHVRVEILHQCIDRLTLLTRYVRDNVTRNQQLPAICCSIAHVTKCVIDFARDHCSHITGEEPGKYLSSILSKAYSRVAQCQENYMSLKGCSRHLSRFDQMAVKVMKADRVTQQNASVLLMFIDMVTS